MMIKTEYGLKVAKELKEVDKQALVTAIVDELKEYDEKYRQHGWPGAMKKTSQKARVLMGLAYSEFMTDEMTDAGYALAEEKRQVLLKALGLDGPELVQGVERLLRGRA